MSKYSLQTECLENIEAYSDEQFAAEMTVIESAMAIFDKAILMMELSNSDIDLPDCSLFMESTFFQEQDGDPAAPKQNAGQTGENPTPAATNNAVNNNANANKANTNNKNAKVTDNPDEYNKDHHFRKANKEGKLENIFISILLFIPRLITLPIKLIVNAIKNNKSGDAAKKAESATPEEKKTATENIKTEGGQNGVTVDENGKLTASEKNAKGETITVSYDPNTGELTLPQEDIGKTMTAVVDDAEKLANGDLTSAQAILTAPEQTNAAPAQPQYQTVKAVNWDQQRESFLKEANKYRASLEQAMNKVKVTIDNLSKNNAAGVDVRKPLAARRADIKVLKGHIKSLDDMLKEFETKRKLNDKILTDFNAKLDIIRQNSVNDMNDASAKATQNSAQLAQNNAEALSNQPLSGGYVV